MSGAWIQGTFDLDLAECKADFEVGIQSGHLDRVLWEFLRGIEADAKAGKDLSRVILEEQPKLQAMLTTLIDELAHIGVSTGFLADGPSDNFDQNGRHIRAREVGWLVAELGRLLVIEQNGKHLNGEELMGVVIDTVKQQMGPTGSGSALSHAWAGVGGWVA